MKTIRIRLLKLLTVVVLATACIGCSSMHPPKLVQAWQQQAYQSYNLTVPQRTGFVPVFFKAVSVPATPVAAHNKVMRAMPQTAIPPAPQITQAVAVTQNNIPHKPAPKPESQDEQQFIADHYGL